MPADTPTIHAPLWRRFLSWLISDRGVDIEQAVAYGPGPRHRLDVYRPANGQEARVVVVFVYGGGWTDGHRDSYRFAGSALAAKGFATVIPDYRLFPEVRFGDFVEDTARAYAWTAGNVAKGRPIVLMGHSAGAHSAALIGLDRRYLERAGASGARPIGLVGLAGPYAFDPTTWPTTKDIFAGANPDDARPVFFANRAAPPALLMHGLKDDTVKLHNSRDLAAALQSNGTEASLFEFRGIGHIGLVTALAWPLRWRAPVLARTIEFLRERERAAPRA
jgi:acetyl esterase/lipase